MSVSLISFQINVQVMVIVYFCGLTKLLTFLLFKNFEVGDDEDDEATSVITVRRIQNV